MLARRQTERPTTGPTTAPNNNWHHAPWRTPRRDRNRERERGTVVARPGPAGPPPPFLFALLFLLSSAKLCLDGAASCQNFSAVAVFAPSNSLDDSEAMASSRGVRAREREEGRTKEQASPLSQIGQKHDDKCGIEYRSSCLTSFGEVRVPGRRRGYGCQVAGRPKARLCRVGLQPQLGHTSMVSLRVGEQE